MVEERSVRSVFGSRKDDLLHPVTPERARSGPMGAASLRNNEKGPPALMAFHFVKVPVTNHTFLNSVYSLKVEV